MKSRANSIDEQQVGLVWLNQNDICKTVKVGLVWHFNSIKMTSVKFKKLLLKNYKKKTFKHYRFFVVLK